VPRKNQWAGSLGVLQVIESPSTRKLAPTSRPGDGVVTTTISRPRESRASRELTALSVAPVNLATNDRVSRRRDISILHTTSGEARHAFEAESRRTEVLIGDLLGPVQTGQRVRSLHGNDLNERHRHEFREMKRCVTRDPLHKIEEMLLS